MLGFSVQKFYERFVPSRLFVNDMYIHIGNNWSVSLRLPMTRLESHDVDALEAGREYLGGSRRRSDLAIRIFGKCSFEVEYFIGRNTFAVDDASRVVSFRLLSQESIMYVHILKIW